MRPPTLEELVSWKNDAVCGCCKRLENEGGVDNLILIEQTCTYCVSGEDRMCDEVANPNPLLYPLPFGRTSRMDSHLCYRTNRTCKAIWLGNAQIIQIDFQSLLSTNARAKMRFWIIHIYVSVANNPSPDDPVSILANEGANPS